MVKEQGNNVANSGKGRIAPVILGVIDIALIIVLVICLLPSQKVSEKLEINANKEFVENSDSYGKSHSREYTSTMTIDYKDNTNRVLSNEQHNPQEQPQSQENMSDASEDSMYSGFVFPDSNIMLLTDIQISQRIINPSTCRRAINEIYARHGFAFTKQENIDYFNTYDWYKNMKKETNMDIVSSEFSSVEKANVEKLQAYEDSNGWS